MSRLFSHISSDEGTLDQWKNEQSTHQQPNRSKDQKIQLCMRDSYAQRIKETAPGLTQHQNKRKPSDSTKENPIETDRKYNSTTIHWKKVWGNVSIVDQR